jgi:hypothetical protein
LRNDDRPEDLGGDRFVRRIALQNLGVKHLGAEGVVRISVMN